MSRKITIEDIFERCPELKCVDLVTNLYMIQEYSLPDFKEQFGLPYNQTALLLKYHNIPKRNISDSKKTKRVKQKVETTNVERFGYVNASQSPIIKNKKKNTFLNNYGVDNIFKNENFKKYQRQRASGKPSALEHRIATTLMDMGIGFTSQKWLNFKCYDFKLTGTKILLEINGDYWHANPLIYKEDELISYPGGALIASAVWARDTIKVENATKYGYNVITIWESEMMQDLPTLILNKLKVE